ncbi:MAG: hypothetical protein HYZ57_07390 [Acidobacteria bacterium]|nr:hypothetical protein [Acidobacteriota bacterium]MBI3279647.1 hypothetical protein [Acidobacteriota bacterium]
MLLFGRTARGENSFAGSAPVEVQMRGVNLHLDRSTVLEVNRLRGEMVPTRPDRPVTFDDANSFVTRIRAAEIGISLATISDLLNERAFGYPGAPLRNINLTAERGRIKQTGTMRKGIGIPFTVEGTLEPTETGQVRLRTDKISVAHVPVKGLLHLFGGNLSKLISFRENRGVTVEGDNVVLHPDRLLPPPRIEGKVTAVRIQGDRIVLSFYSGKVKELHPPYKTSSYIYHRGGVLRFGKLTMSDADLEIVSASKRTPFDFSLPEYNRQLTAGYSKNTPSHGLIVFMRDFVLLRPKPSHAASS